MLWLFDCTKDANASNGVRSNFCEFINEVSLILDVVSVKDSNELKVVERSSSEFNIGSSRSFGVLVGPVKEALELVIGILVGTDLKRVL